MRVPAPTLIRALSVCALFLFASANASAHGQPRINWSITVGSPYYEPAYQPPPAVYIQPQPIYVQPRPVYIQPQPIYVQQPPVIEYQNYYPGAYYTEPVRWNRRQRGERYYHHRGERYYHHDRD